MKSLKEIATIIRAVADDVDDTTSNMTYQEMVAVLREMASDLEAHVQKD